MCIYQQIKGMKLYMQEVQVIFKKVKGFTENYSVDKLVHIEQTVDGYSTIIREKQLKKWKRSWKLRLIEENNPQRKYLLESL